MIILVSTTAGLSTERPEVYIPAKAERCFEAICVPSELVYSEQNDSAWLIGRSGGKVGYQLASGVI